MRRAVLIILAILSLTGVRSEAAALTLTWTASAGTVDGYKVERSANGGAYIPIATNGANVTSYTDGSVLAATAYSYRVRAFNTVGDSDYSNVAGTAVGVYPPGDVNASGSVTGGDALLIKQVGDGLRNVSDPKFQVSGYATGDVNQDGSVNAADWLLINDVTTGKRAYIVSKILPASRLSTVPTAVTIYGIGFPINGVTKVQIGPPVNVTLSNVVVISEETIQAVMPAGGGLGTGTVTVSATSTNGVMSFGRFTNQ
jgi:hypothetical protein